MSKQQVAFIGLGVMGYPMAGHLATAGIKPGFITVPLPRLKMVPGLPGQFCIDPARGGRRRGFCIYVRR